MFSLEDDAVIHMELSRIIISETNDEQVIVLKEVDGERAFPIVIGIWEAVAIDRNIKGKKTPRPMTHDLIENVIAGLDARLERVIVSDLKDRTFFARLILRRNGKQVERPLLIADHPPCVDCPQKFSRSALAIDECRWNGDAIRNCRHPVSK
jgi:hypothetical protein